MKTFKLFLVIAFFVSVVSCNREKDDIIPQTKQESDLYKRILAAGFSKDKIIEYKDYFLVEGDIMFKKFDKLKTSPVLKQAYDNTVNVNFGDIKVYLDYNTFTQQTQLDLENSYPGSISNAVDGALAEYNGLLWPAVAVYNTSWGGIHFSRTYNQTEADITISEGSLNGVAWAVFPSGGSPGNQIILNDYALNQKSCNDTGYLVYLLVHELGHTIGLRHTNWSYIGESTPAETVPGTYGYDQFSVMNGSYYTDPLILWGGFSNGDVTAISYKYTNLFIEPDYFSIGSGAWSEYTSVYTNCTSWSIESSDSSWLTHDASSLSGNEAFHIYATQNTTGYAREGYLEIYYGNGLTKRVTVVQAAE